MSRFLTVRGKIMALVVLVVVLLTGLDAVAGPARTAAAEEQSLRSRARALAAVMSDSVAFAAGFKQTDALQEELRGLLADELVLWGAVYGKDGATMATLLPDSKEKRAKGDLAKPPVTLEVSSEFREIPSSDAQVVAAAPLRFEGSVIGSVAIALSASSIAERRDATRNEVLLQASVVLLLGLVVAYFGAGSIARSVVHLTAAAERIAAGDVNASIGVKAPRDELGEMVRAFNRMNDKLRQLQDTASRVAAGDLQGDIEDGGELYQSFSTMVRSLRDLAIRIRSSSDSVATAAADMFASAREQESSSTQQTAALEEIRKTLESLSSSAEQVSTDTATVRVYAQRSLSSSEHIAEQTRLMSAHSDRIGDILAQIQEIADKADLLALNAALEGTKAGEVGRGFSLVANEMRRLSEHVMDQVRDIRKLISDMRSAAHASVLATEEGIKLAHETAASANKITDAITRHQKGTGQVKASADEIVRVVNEALAMSVRSTSSAEALLGLSHELREAVRTFNVSADNDTVAPEISRAG